MAPTKTLDGSAFSFTTTRGHTTHISILWVFVLFSFLTVAVVLLGGYQEGLVERKLPDTLVTDKMEVTQALQVNQAGNPGFFTGMQVRKTTATTVDLSSDTAHMIDYDGNEGVNTELTLPEATTGNKVVIGLAQKNAAATRNLVINCGAGDAFETNSLVPSTATNQVIFNSSLENQDTLTYTPGALANTLINIGSQFYFYCTNKGRWHVYVYALTSETEGNAGTLEFSNA